MVVIINEEDVLGNEKIPGKNYTVGSLFFHSVILLTFAVGSYLDSLTPPIVPANDLIQAAPIIFCTMGAISLCLTIGHYHMTLSREWLKRWAAFQILVSVYALLSLTSGPMIMPAPNQPQISRLAIPLLFVVYFLPVVSIYVFAGWEDRRRSNQEVIH